MTRDEFISRFRRQLLGYLGECWAARREDRTQFGAMMDAQMLDAKRLLGEMYDALEPKPKPFVAPSGVGKPKVI